MLEDLPDNKVKKVGIAVCLEDSGPGYQNWSVYLVNMNDHSIEMVLISSKGYGNVDGEAVKTSTLRHSFERIEAREYALIEPIDPKLFALTNEFWISYYIKGEMYDKKYVFVTESITEDNLIHIPLLDKPGVFIV